MNRLVFVLVVIGFWGMALLWITMEPPKTSVQLDEPVAIAEGEESCGLIARIQYEVTRFSDEVGFAHLVPKRLIDESETCAELFKADSDDDDDPLASHERGVPRRRQEWVDPSTEVVSA